jgi:uncharacterized phiE125 gp8 family phage protein
MTFGFTNEQSSQVIYKARAYTYIPIAPVPPALPRFRPIDVSDLKSHLKIDYLDEEQENYINQLIDAATNSAEKFTGRSFINQKWRTFRDFSLEFIELGIGTNATVDSFKYINTSSVLTDVPADIYYVKVEDPFSKIIIKDSMSFPSDVIQQQSCIQIEFTAGYGATKDAVPAMLRLLLCQHVTWMYENKGNCPVDEIPPMVRDGYMKHFRVMNLNAATFI